MGRFDTKYPTSKRANIALSNLKRIVNEVITPGFGANSVRQCLHIAETFTCINVECKKFANVRHYAKHDSLGERWFVPISFANGAKPKTKLYYAGTLGEYSVAFDRAFVPYDWENCFVLCKFAGADYVKVSEARTSVYLDIIANKRRYSVAVNSVGSNALDSITVRTGHNTSGLFSRVVEHSFDDMPSLVIYELSKWGSVSSSEYMHLISETWHKEGVFHRLGKPSFVRRAVNITTFDTLLDIDSNTEYFIDGERFRSAMQYVRAISALETQNNETYIPKQTKVLMTLEDNFDVV